MFIALPTVAGVVEPCGISWLSFTSSGALQSGHWISSTAMWQSWSVCGNCCSVYTEFTQVEYAHSEVSTMCVCVCVCVVLRVRNPYRGDLKACARSVNHCSYSGRLIVMWLLSRFCWYLAHVLYRLGISSQLGASRQGICSLFVVWLAHIVLWHLSDFLGVQRGD